MNRKSLSVAVLLVGCLLPAVVRAQAPANATAKCKDGTYSESKQHSGACSHHGGVAEWYR